jgi:hypothetical protein
VDFAVAASQNGFSTYKLSLHWKTNNIQKMTKTLDFLKISSLTNQKAGGKKITI